MIERVDVDLERDNPVWRKFRSEHRLRYELSRDFLHKYLSFDAKIVADAACGHGYGAEYLRSFGSYVGLDHDRVAVDEARRRYPGVTFLRADLDSPLPFTHGSVDAVVSHETAEHLNNPFFFFDQVYKILKPKGVFCFSAPTSLTRDFDPYHLRDWCRARWAHELGFHGFTVKECVPMPFEARFTDFIGAVPTTLVQKLRILAFAITHRRYRRDRWLNWVLRNRFFWESCWFGCIKE